MTKNRPIVLDYSLLSARPVGTQQQVHRASEIGCARGLTFQPSLEQGLLRPAEPRDGVLIVEISTMGRLRCITTRVTLVDGNDYWKLAKIGRLKIGTHRPLAYDAASRYHRMFVTIKADAVGIVSYEIKCHTETPHSPMTEFCIHIANVFYLVSFLHRDILWLRVLTCIGLTFGIVFFTTCATPMYGPAGWHGVFLFINFYQIYRLVEERQTTNLDTEKELIGVQAVDDLSRDTLLNVLAHEMSGSADQRRDLKTISKQELDDEAVVLKRLVLERLSRREIINLLSRRMWNPIQRRFKRRKPEIAATT